MRGDVVPERPHGLESRAEVAAHLLVVGKGGPMPHLALPLQSLAQLHLQAFFLLVQDPQPLPVLLDLRGECCDGALQSVGIIVLAEPPADDCEGRWGRRSWVRRDKHSGDDWND